MAIRVLVVEQNAALRQVIVDALETSSYAAFGSDGVTDALAISAVERPDVVVIDAHPRGGGDAGLVRFLRELRSRENRPVLVVAICSADARPQLVGAGAHCTIGKPVSERELLVALRWLESVYLGASSEAEQAQPSPW